MTDASAPLPPELVAEAMTVMGRAFVAIRSATHSRYGSGGDLSERRMAAIGTLADVLHNMPAWVRSDPEGRWVSDEVTVRRELDTAVRAIDFLQNGDR